MIPTTPNSLYAADLLGSYRYGGILLHPSSLPSKFGIGDLGPNLYRFIDFLHRFGQQLWQILPLGPTGYGDSPYQSFSTFAGNPMLISPEKLCELGLLSFEEIESVEFPESRVNYGKVIPYKWRLLEQAFEKYNRIKPVLLKQQFIIFEKTQQYWLEDYALFMSIKKAHSLKAWNTWEDPYKFREQKFLSQWKKNHNDQIKFHKFVQLLFFNQWNDIRKYARLKNVKIIGDIPIFVAYDSADVWASKHLFSLDNHGELLFVAGVPPDYFSETGQRWGNPLYKWDVLKKQNYQWWLDRIRHNLSLVDLLRIDHFRGFEAYWQIPADEPTAEVGKWVSGPGIDLFLTLKKALGPLPIIAEDLGVITPSVKDLLRKTGFPGMRVLQFAFGDNLEEFPEVRFLPHNYIKNTIAYTGTHDNDTTVSWFKSASKGIQDHVQKYLNSSNDDVVGDLIRLIWSSIAQMSVIPLQDLLRLDKEGRMNHPGTESGNWEWRFRWEQLTDDKGMEMAKLSEIYER